MGLGGNEMLKLNLQYFAEETIEDSQQEETQETTEEQQEEPTYSQSDVDRQISKAVDSALKKQRAKWEEEKQQEIEKAKNEAEEYAKMSQKEKEEAEIKKRLEEIKKREQELNNRQLLAEIETDLKDNNLPSSFAEALLSIQDNEKIKQAITGIKKDFDEAVNAQVKEALRQDTPDEGTQDLTQDVFQQKVNKYKQ